MLDSLGMFDLTADLPEQVEDAAERAGGLGGLARAGRRSSRWW